MKFRMLHIFLFCYCCTLAPSCNHSHQTEGLQAGDILFQNLDCGELCDAIKAVTAGIEGNDFTHCALVLDINDTLKIIEAIGEKVQLNSLENFFARSGDTTIITHIAVGRLKDEYQNHIPRAITNAKQLIGQPYDNEFLMNNKKWYCSELIFEVFKEANVKKNFFALEPMTFKYPKTNTFLPTWETYYKAIGREIPEGQLGINPGLISRSDKIRIIKILSFK